MQSIYDLNKKHQGKMAALGSVMLQLPSIGCSIKSRVISSQAVLKKTTFSFNPWFFNGNATEFSCLSWTQRWAALENLKSIALALKILVRH